MTEEFEALVAGEKNAEKDRNPAARQARIERLRQAHAEMTATGSRMALTSAAVGGVHGMALLALGLATVVAAIWMVFARVRDIGWPIWVSFAVLAPKLLLRLYGVGVPEALLYGTQALFMLSIVGLGLIPTGFGGGSSTMPPAPRRMNALASPVGPFGRRA